MSTVETAMLRTWGPAWQRTLALYAERVGVSVDDIR